MTRFFLLHGGALGDCVLALHFADIVKRLLAADRVVVAARSSVVHWARRVGWIDEAITLDASRSRGRVAAENGRAAARKELDTEFDVVVSMVGLPKPELLEQLGIRSNARVVTIDPREESPGAGGGRHIMAQWIGRFEESCAAQGFAGEMLTNRPLFDPTSSAFRPDRAYRATGRAALARELQVDDGRLIVIVHPGSGSARKCPPIEVMESLVDELVEGAKANVAWMIGPDEWERHGETFHQRLSRRAPVLWREDVENAADLVAGADVYIGMDSGMTHVAAVCSRRTVAIFGPTDPAVWRPIGDSCEIVGFPADLRDPSCARGWLRGIRDALRSG